MKVQSVFTGNIVQAKNKVSAPNFGSVLLVSDDVYNFEEKEYLTQKLNNHEKIKSDNFKKAFDKKIKELQEYCAKLAPKQFHMKLKLSQEAKEYTDSPYIDFNGENYDGNPFVIETAYPMFVEGYELSKSVELPSLLNNELTPAKNVMRIVASEFSRLQNDV